MLRPVGPPSTPPPRAAARPRPAEAPEPTESVTLSRFRVPHEGWLDTAIGWSAGLAAPLFGFLGEARRHRLPPPSQEFLSQNKTVHGQHTSTASPARTSLEKQPLRTYAVTCAQEMAQLQFGDLLAGTHPQRGPVFKTRTVTKERLAQELQSAREARQRKLDHIETTRPAPTAVPKDSSLNPQAFSMFARPGETLNLGFVKQMAELGQVEGFRVLVETPYGSATALREELQEMGVRNVHVLPTRGDGETWTEDYGEMNLAQGAGLPSLIDHSVSEAAVNLDRLQRFPTEHRWWKPSTWLAPDPGHFDQLGAVSEGGFQESLAGAALARGLKIRENFSHIEGGNLLTGTLPDGQGYALVGRDSVAVTRAVLEKDLGRPVDEREALVAISKDLGMDVSNVHPIEQPGAFHLDMRMMLAAPGQVILNDAREAALLQEKWLRDDHRQAEPEVTGPISAMRHFGWKLKGRALETQITGILAEADRRARYEDRTAAELEAAGLHVDRLPGVFVVPGSAGSDQANLINGRHGVNEQGERFFIALGAEQRAETEVAHRLMQVLPTGISRVHFLDRELTPQTLDLSGGIKCRTKPEGELHLAPSPAPTLSSNG